MDFVEKMRCLWFRLFYYFSYYLRKLLCMAFGGEECLCCGKLSFGAPLCSRCANKRFLEPSVSVCSRCPVCGRPLVSERGLCMDCRRSRTVFHADSVFPVFAYRLWKKNLLFSWKMSDRRSLSPLFAAVCDGVLKTGFGEGCVLVPVPPRAGKIRRRGWDQIDELCRYLRFFYGYKVLYLLRRLSTVQQKKLDRSHRLSGIGKAYTLSSKGRAFCDKKRMPAKVIVIDDVLTTGATAENCCSVLKEAGVLKVCFLSLFIVD